MKWPSFHTYALTSHLSLCLYPHLCPCELSLPLPELSLPLPLPLLLLLTKLGRPFVLHQHITSTNICLSIF